MRHFFLPYIIFFVVCLQAIESKEDKDAQDLVVATTRIVLNRFPKAFNPSLISLERGFLLTFRHCLWPHEPWTSYIGIVLLNDRLQPVSQPQLLRTRSKGAITPSQSEDARIFACNGRIYLIYNDNVEFSPPENPCSKRDMFLAELSYNGHKFTLSEPIKLTHSNKMLSSRVQKNWTPFEWQKKLLLIYTNHPHEILMPDIPSGLCDPIYTTLFDINWKWGEMRGGSPAQLVDGEYLSFFHSSIVTSSHASRGNRMHHYYMGAYTFTAEPPFEVTKMSSSPIVGKGFYTQSDSEKRVVFPGGYAVKGKYIYVAFGKDDREMWVAIIEKAKLQASLKKCTPRR